MTRLVADLGGTNARFALVRDGEPDRTVNLPVEAHPTFGAALDAALDALDGRGIEEAAIAAAGPRLGSSIKMTNVPWTLSAASISRRLDGAPVRLVNDLEAVALALPHLTPAEWTALRGEGPRSGLPLLAVNVGTGFGAAAAHPAGTGWLAVGGEPGHMTLAPVDAAEREIIGDCVSVEDLLSGPGIARLEQRRSGGGAITAETRRVFGRVLGRVAGDLVLAAGAWGGLFLCGGVVHGWDDPAGIRGLLERFDAKGKMAAMMAEVPVMQITAAEPALLGLARTRVN